MIPIHPSHTRSHPIRFSSTTAKPREAFEFPVTYFHSNRDLVQLSLWYPPHLLDLKELRDLSVLDVGTGFGAFVYNLREHGVNAVGIDKMSFTPHDLLTKLKQKENLHRDHKSTWRLDQSRLEDFSQHMIRADASKLPFADQSFDRVYSSWSIFSYPNENHPMKLAILKEMARVLKPRGKIRMSPVNQHEILSLLQDPALRSHLDLTKPSPQKRGLLLNDGTPGCCMELKKV